MATYAAIGNRNTALRIINAEKDFLETLIAFGGLTAEEARVAFAKFKAVKALKLDAVGGRYTVKHGAFLARDVIRRAAGIEA